MTGGLNIVGMDFCSVWPRFGQHHKLQTTNSSPWPTLSACKSRGAAKRLGRSHRSGLRSAIGQDDKHAVALWRWVDAIIIGVGLCPWARPACDSGRLKVATSTARDGEGILADLREEAQALQGLGPEPPPGRPTTTLLACPNVPEWAEFEDFHTFFEKVLGDGDAFEEEFGLKIVRFHPLSDVVDGTLQVGDEVVFSSSGGPSMCGKVMRNHAGNEEGEPFVEVRLVGTFLEGVDSSGFSREPCVQPLGEAERTELVPHSSIIWLLSRSHDLSNPDFCRSLLGRAPVPAFHLLRITDLEAIEDRHGLDTISRNEVTVREFGWDGFSSLVEECG